MKVREFTVVPCELAEIREFVEKWHYSGNVNGLRVAQCFALYNNEELIGGMIYGGMGMANAWKKYGETEAEVVELRRLCCIDDTPKNTESYFIGRSLRWLRQNTDYKVVVSYADAHYGHKGTIYKASNFQHVGMTAKGRIIKWGEREYHDKTIRTYYTNKDGVKNLKPFAQRVKDALESGEAQYMDRPPKHIYLYSL
tara:strand:+ start:1235 stop:1825 length:591 start_codon:yes stop_codon:yes gene_type:complete